MNNNVKVGDFIIYASFTYDENGKIEHEYKKKKILGISKYFIVLNDDLFTQLANCKTFAGCHAELDKVKCYKDRLIESYPQEIKCYVYSTSMSKKINTNRIKNGIRNFLLKESWMYNNIDNIIDKIKF